MPVVPETPNRSSTIDEMMMVSIVMPETGLRAVVAIALAATEVKKNEKTSVSTRPTRMTDRRGGEPAEEDAHADRADGHARPACS